MEQSRLYRSKLRKLGADIVRSLISEGYTLVSQSNACERVILRHRTNGHWITVQCRQLGVWVYKDDKCVKVELL